MLLGSGTAAGTKLAHPEVGKRPHFARASV